MFDERLLLGRRLRCWNAGNSIPCRFVVVGTASFQRLAAGADNKTGDRSGASLELGFANEVVTVGDGLGKEIGVQPGDFIGTEMDNADRIRYLKAWRPDLADQENIKFAWRHGGEIDVIGLPLGKLPAHSLRVHPTQIYSSVNAFLLCLLLWMYWYHRRSLSLIHISEPTRPY